MTKKYQTLVTNLGCAFAAFITFFFLASDTVPFSADSLLLSAAHDFSMSPQPGSSFYLLIAGIFSKVLATPSVLPFTILSALCGAASVFVILMATPFLMSRHRWDLGFVCAVLFATNPTVVSIFVTPGPQAFALFFAVCLLFASFALQTVESLSEVDKLRLLFSIALLWQICYLSDVRSSIFLLPLPILAILGFFRKQAGSEKLRKLAIKSLGTSFAVSILVFVIFVFSRSNVHSGAPFSFYINYLTSVPLISFGEAEFISTVKTIVGQSYSGAIFTILLCAFIGLAFIMLRQTQQKIWNHTLLCILTIIGAATLNPTAPQNSALAGLFLMELSLLGTIGLHQFGNTFINSLKFEKRLVGALGFYFLLVQIVFSTPWNKKIWEDVSQSLLTSYLSQVSPGDVLFVSPIEFWNVAHFQSSVEKKKTDVTMVATDWLENPWYVQNHLKAKYPGISTTYKENFKYILKAAWAENRRTFSTILDTELFGDVSWRPQGLLVELFEHPVSAPSAPVQLEFSRDLLSALSAERSETQEVLAQQLAVAYANNAMAYVRNNNLSEALKNIEFAANLAPSNPQLRELLSKMQPQFSEPAAFKYKGP